MCIFTKYSWARKMREFVVKHSAVVEMGGDVWKRYTVYEGRRHFIGGADVGRPLIMDYGNWSGRLF